VNGLFLLLYDKTVLSQELERTWKEEIVVHLKLPSKHLHGGTEKTWKINCQDIQFLGRDYFPGPPEYGAGLSVSHPRRSVLFP
jgi:hypothetical protein